MLNIFLFHRDLRCYDNTTLIEQIKQEIHITPIFIFPPEQINPKINKYFSNNSVQFMIESLHELSNEIKKFNSKIYFFQGDTQLVLKKIHKTYIINSIGYNIDYTPYAKKRDNLIKEFALKNNIKIYEKEDYVLYDVLNNEKQYLVFTPFKNYCLKNLTVRQPNKFKHFKFKKHDFDIKYLMDEQEIEKFYIDNPNIQVHGGRSNGLKILNNLDKFKNYSQERDNLTYQTTCLSAYNHFSCISIREEYYKIIDKLTINSGLINELHWREFYINITWNFPHVLNGQIDKVNRPFKEKYENLKFIHNKKWFQEWCDGETGFPIVDAGIRQMNKTGYMHNRNRMITVAWLTKDAHINWIYSELYFAQKLVDYSPMQNSGGHQWTSSVGVDASPYFRIFNPWRQTIKYDKDCQYIKKWIPELEQVPNKDILNWNKPEIHNKWLNDGILYFKPTLDHDKERKITLEMFKNID
jgi:deoxyribodipyrimidine photo-lyase